SEERHPLVMHHVTTNDDPSRSAGFGPPGVVDRLVVPVVTEKRRVAQLGNSPQVFHGGCRFPAESEGCRIWSDNQVLFLPAPQRQLRHAERAVLIDVMPVESTVCGFRDAPWHAALLGITNLAAHSIMTCAIEQRILVRLSEQKRH